MKSQAEKTERVTILMPESDARLSVMRQWTLENPRAPSCEMLYDPSWNHVKSTMINASSRADRWTKALV